MKKYESKSLESTEKIAKDFLKIIKQNKQKKTATVVGLYGDLGAGKTTFTKMVASLLGIKDVVSSPTFVLIKGYSLKSKDFESLIHLDAYRFGKEKELLDLGWQKMIDDPKNLIFIEWPEKVLKIMPESHICIYFNHINEHERGIEIHHKKHVE